MAMSATARQQQGFTLVEILIAVAVVAWVLAAATGAASQAVQAEVAQQERTFAHWVAENVLTEYRLEPGWPDVDEYEGEAEMGDRSWRWRATVSETAVEDLRRIDVEVWAAGDETDTPAVRRSGFISPQRSHPTTSVWAPPTPGQDEQDEQDDESETTGEPES